MDKEVLTWLICYSTAVQNEKRTRSLSKHLVLSLSMHLIYVTNAMILSLLMT